MAADNNYVPYIEPSDITYDIKIGLPYGEMPDTAIISKFEQTNLDVDQDYDDYARKLLVDRSPDAATMQCEEPRKSLSNKGYLNLLHYGNRSGSEPAHREAFLADTWGDPRGIAVDPDMKQLRKQHEARTKFVRWSSDADNSTPSGVISEPLMIKYRQEAFKATRPRMMIFSTSKDGKRNGMARVFTHESDIRKTDQGARSYGDLITTDAVTPQRHTDMISNTNLVNSKMYQQNTTDHEFEVARYGQDSRRRQLKNDMQTMHYYDTDQKFAAEDRTANYKSQGMLMAQIVKNKHTAQQEIDMGTSDQSQSRRHDQAHKNLKAAIVNIAQEANFGTSDHTQQRKTPGQEQIAHLLRRLEEDGSTPANAYLNAMMIFRGVREGGDLRAIKGEIVTDDRKVDMRDETTQARLAAVANTIQHANRRESEVEVDGQSLTPHSYRASARVKKANEQTMVNPEKFGAQHDITQSRRTDTQISKNPDKAKANTQIEFLDNQKLDRHAAPLGTKYTMRQIAREEASTIQLGA